MNSTTTPRPENQFGNGGIAIRASSTSRAVIASIVAALPGVDVPLHDRAKTRVAERARRRLLVSAGRRSSTAARALCSALFTDAALVSSDPPPRGPRPSTSRG